MKHIVNFVSESDILLTWQKLILSFCDSCGYHIVHQLPFDHSDFDDDYFSSFSVRAISNLQYLVSVAV